MVSNEPRQQWYHEDLPRFRDALTFTEAESGFSSRLIEKDYICTLILQDLSLHFEHRLVFKGGTCLSKVHAKFFRLSEDLDFAVPTPPDATRSVRRLAGSLIRDYFSGVPSRLTCLELADPIEGHNNSRQYNGRFAYHSMVTSDREFIKVEVSLREEIILPPEVLPARTLLVDPLSAQPALPSVNVQVLQLREAYAEKIRAALTRTEPAIRDFFDIDHAQRGSLFAHRTDELLNLVAAKLSVAENDPVDLSETKLALLRGQLKTQLQPVLRTADFEAFDLERAFGTLQEIMQLHRSR
jgi:predicted nucleotidyltransferase component of viral defense system